VKSIPINILYRIGWLEIPLPHRHELFQHNLVSSMKYLDLVLMHEEKRINTSLRV